jgi:integrase
MEDHRHDPFNCRDSDSDHIFVICISEGRDTDKEMLLSLSVFRIDLISKCLLRASSYFAILMLIYYWLAMPGRQAKILSLNDVNDLLVFATCTRHPFRNRLIVLLAAKAGLRAGEIANLTWDMVLDPTGDAEGLRRVIALTNTKVDRWTFIVGSELRISSFGSY